MYGLDNSSGVNVMPKLAPVSSATPLWFTEGGAGLAASYPGQDWFNMVQAEMLGILTTGGIKPEKGKLNQLSEAIKKIVNSADFQPAGDYATNTALKNGLDGKLDNTGGVLSGHLSVIGRVYARSNNTVDANEISIDAINASGNCINSKRGTDPATTHYLPKTTGTLMQVGDYGLGATGLPQYANMGTAVDYRAGFYGIGGTDAGKIPGNGGCNIVQVGAGNYFFQLGKTTLDDVVWFRSAKANQLGSWIKILSESNTTKDANNFLRTGSKTTLITENVVQTTGASTVNVMSQKAVTDKVFGENQSYQDVTSARSLGVAYTNSTSKAIFVSVTSNGWNDRYVGFDAFVDNSIIATSVSYGAATRAQITFIVPPGASYKVAYSSSTETSGVKIWSELR